MGTSLRIYTSKAIELNSKTMKRATLGRTSLFHSFFQICFACTPRRYKSLP
jgi:hypothetical protein